VVDCDPSIVAPIVLTSFSEGFPFDRDIFPSLGNSKLWVLFYFKPEFSCSLEVKFTYLYLWSIWSVYDY